MKLKRRFIMIENNPDHIRGMAHRFDNMEKRRAKPVQKRELY